MQCRCIPVITTPEDDKKTGRKIVRILWIHKKYRSSLFAKYILFCDVMCGFYRPSNQFPDKIGFEYYFIHCSRKYMEHVNFKQLTLKLVFQKLDKLWAKPNNQPYTINVTTHRPSSTTDSHHMHGQDRMLLTALHDAELFDMHWN